jgi:serine/threonine protein kinase
VAADPSDFPGLPGPPPAAPPPPPPSRPPPAAPSATAANGTYTDDELGKADPYVGRTIAGKFQILDLLGQGGMGKVFKAKHVGLDRTVCIKMLRQALVEDQTVVGRFEREAKAASRLNHAHSIQILDFGQDEYGSLYIVMEFVSGKDLRKTLRDEFPLGEERICHIMMQVLSALAEAHAQNVIHRDLKPENIMIEQRRGEPDFVKVLDFGIAKIQDPDVPGLTRADVVCGTPLYMSPEQATGSKFDARADLYAIGVILYQLTTGTLPFDGANSMEILTKHVTELPVPPKARRPEVAISQEMEDLILRALDKDPAGRPANAEEFRAELVKIMDRARRAREDAEIAAKAASTQYKAERDQALRDKQAAQRAAISASRQAGTVADAGASPAPGPSSLPAPGATPAAAPSRMPLYAGIGIAAVAAVGAAVVLLKPTPAPQPPVRPAETPAVATPARPPDPVQPANPPATTPTAVAANPTATTPNPVPTVTVTPVANPQKPPTTLVTAVSAPPNPSTDPTSGDTHPGNRKPPREAVKGDPVEAKRVVDEEGDPDYEEGNFKKAVADYRRAIHADPTYAPAYKGLYKAGVGAADRSAIREGGHGYLKYSPDAPDAAKVREVLARF